ncbi:hypothetical protein ARMSODRAFT_1016768 [Armillaria solidipes]|uniref:Uncharacterized protein n=1 Tax=Armillaria solidipes TaxID=1076256 RepID=A0A2H3C913_9AGAR|nr:hypothetical protein ARMSODRAFT_1016768 [Armillaria solidipes]
MQIPAGTLGVLQHSMGFLMMIGRIAYQYPLLEMSPFILNVLFTCEGVIGMLSLASCLPEFQSWELQLNEYTGQNILQKDVPFSDMIQQAMGAPASHKCKAEEEEPEREESENKDDSKVNMPKKAGSGTSAGTPSQKPVNCQSWSSNAPATKSCLDIPAKPENVPSTWSSKTLATASPKSAPAGPFSKGVKEESPQVEPFSLSLSFPQKFKSMEPTTGATVIVDVPQGPPCKTTKTQSGSVKDEPGIAHSYEEKLAKPVKPEEIKAILKVFTKGGVSTATTARQLARAFALFMLNSHSAMMPAGNWTNMLRPPSKCSTAALQIFEQSANAATLAAHSFRISMEETLYIWGDAIANEGEETLTGIVVEDPGFAGQICKVLNGMGPAPMSDFQSFQGIVKGTSTTKLIHLVKKVKSNKETKPVGGTSPIDIVKSSSTKVALPVSLCSQTSPIPMQKPLISPLARETADRFSDLVKVTGPLTGTSRDSAEHDVSPSNRDFNSYKEPIVMGTPGADPDEDLLHSAISSQVKKDKYSQLMDSIIDTDDKSSKCSSRKPKKKSSHCCHSNDSVHSFRKTLAKDDVI